MNFQLQYAWTSLVTILAILMYLVIGINVGRTRTKHKIFPPATTGHPEVERAFRAHQNTLEALIMFLPLLWIFSIYLSSFYGMILGFVWIIGRIAFAVGYTIEANKRFVGFAISVTVIFVYLIGSLIAVIKEIIN
ncbi:MAG: MAPEG family protein [Candidatus Caenarcaniphilales bacterium]|nr:MAPEG family protein [Candidatus Caenarcaniphilales bacterium]